MLGLYSRIRFGFRKMPSVAKGNRMPYAQPCPSWVPSIPSSVCFSDISHKPLGEFSASLVSTFYGICISALRYCEWVVTVSFIHSIIINRHYEPSCHLIIIMGNPHDGR